MLTGAIVLYNNNLEKLTKSIDSFLQIPCEKHLYLIDNSKSKQLEFQLQYKTDVTYIHTGSNLGFGSGHNTILNKIKTNSTFHLILNPDIYFDGKSVIEMIAFMNKNPEIGVLGPKILYPNGELQHSIRRFPKPEDFFIRRIPFLKKAFYKKYVTAHYLNIIIDKPIMVDYVSGCFQLFKTEIFLKIKGYDERFFMYLEDIDICKEVFNTGYKICYYPDTEVYHYFEKGSAKDIKLLLMHIHSLIKYFLKWKLKMK